MARAGEVALDFGGEERTFCLRIGELRKVQERCDAGPGEIAQRLAGFMLLREGKLPLAQAAALGRLGTWRVDDVREVILQGLVGGGMTPNDAGQIVRHWVDGRPWAETIPVAYQVILASIIGVDDEDAAGEPQGAAPLPSQTEN